MAVELQLGLALPTALIKNPIAIKELLFDLNSSSNYSDGDESDASTKFCRSSMSGDHSFDRNENCCKIMKKKKKRSCKESSESDCASTDTPPRTLPVLLWNKQPKDEDDLPNDDKNCNLTPINNGEETEGIVGWPPITSYWKKQRGQDPAAGWYAGGRRGVGSNGFYVKVQVEGMAITRKIDLNPHRSYETLTSTLLFMFGKGHESVDKYNLTYQDKDGDWLLATDLPWRIFMESVQRLKLLRKEQD